MGIKDHNIIGLTPRLDDVWERFEINRKNKNMFTEEEPGWILDFALMGNLSQVGIVREGDVVSRVPVQASGHQ